MTDNEALSLLRDPSAESEVDQIAGSKDPAVFRTGWLNLRRRVTGALVIVSLVPLIVVSLLFFFHERNSRTEEALDRLEAVAHVQKARVGASIFDYFGVDLPVALSRTEMLRLVAVYSEKGDEANLALLKDEIDKLVAVSTVFNEVSLVSLDGIVIVASDGARVGQDLSSSEFVMTARYGNRLGPWSLDDAGELIQGVAGPLVVDGVSLAILVIEMSGRNLLDLVADRTGLGETGETVVAVRDERGDAVFITPVRFDPNAAFSRRVPRTALEVPITQALLGNETLFRVAIDYRGEEVLAASRYISGAGLGLVVKIDTSEAFARVGDLRLIVTLGIGVIGIIAIVSAVFLARSIVDPIEELRDVALVVAGGDFDVRAVTRRGDEVGQLTHVFNLMTEIIGADRRELQLRVDSRTEELSRALVDLERFSSAAAHDLQEPLRKVTVFGERLTALAADTLSDQGQDYLDRMTAATARMQRLVDRLLAYSRVTTRAEPFVLVDLGEVAASAVADLTDLVTETGGIIEIGDLPAIEVDSSQVRQMFRVIVENALKYAGQGEPPSVWISAEYVTDHQLLTRGRVCRIVIDDDGTGFDSEDSERIFEGFTKLHATSSETGMGLAVCRRIVERHGGSISAASAPGEGASFTIMLPATQRSDQERLEQRTSGSAIHRVVK